MHLYARPLLSLFNQLAMIISLLQSVKEGDSESQVKVELGSSKFVEVTKNSKGSKHVSMAIIQSTNKEGAVVEKWAFPMNLNEWSQLQRRKGELKSRYQTKCKEVGVVGARANKAAEVQSIPVFKWINLTEEGEEDSVTPPTCQYLYYN